MGAEMVAACAAVAAAAVSLINIEATRRLTRSMESTKWTRDLLPDLVRELDQAQHEQYMAYFDADWVSLTGADAADVGMAEFRRASDARDRLEVFAAPETITAARAVSQALTDMRVTFLRHIGEDVAEGKWRAYWRYAEASHQFLNAARKEMGLRRAPVPPGLANRRKHVTGSPSTPISLDHRG